MLPQLYRHAWKDHEIDDFREQVRRYVAAEFNPRLDGFADSADAMTIHFNAAHVVSRHERGDLCRVRFDRIRYLRQCSSTVSYGRMVSVYTPGSRDGVG